MHERVLVAEGDVVFLVPESGGQHDAGVDQTQRMFDENGLLRLGDHGGQNGEVAAREYDLCGVWPALLRPSRSSAAGFIGRRAAGIRGKILAFPFIVPTNTPTSATNFDINQNL